MDNKRSKTPPCAACEGRGCVQEGSPESWSWQPCDDCDGTGKARAPQSTPPAVLEITLLVVARRVAGCGGPAVLLCQNSPDCRCNKIVANAMRFAREETADV